MLIRLLPCWNRLCCTAPPAQWCLAVEDELKARYLGILKCLCKHKYISDLFKDSPKKVGSCTCRERQSDSEADKCGSISTCCEDSTEPVSNREEDSRTPVCGGDNNSRSILGGEEDPKTPVSAGQQANGKGDANRLNPSSETNLDANLEDQFAGCTCYSGTKMKVYRSLLAIKTNVHNNQYSTVSSFYLELENVIAPMEEPFLLKMCSDVVKRFFPWFDPKLVPLDEVPENISEFLTNDSTLQNDPATEDIVANDDYATLRKLFAEEEYRYENFRLLDVRTCNFCKGNYWFF